MVSLGTSTTLLVTTNVYNPSSNYHVFNHPVIPESYMGMLCYKNGSLARETVRNKVHKATDCSTATNESTWLTFNARVETTRTLCKSNDTFHFGFYFVLPEILPPVRQGEYRFSCLDGQKPSLCSWDPSMDPRAILESQFLSLRKFTVLVFMLCSIDF